MEEMFVPGVWYRTGNLIFQVERTGRFRRNKAGEMVEDMRKRVTIRVDAGSEEKTETKAKALFALLQAATNL